jgi:hypothetical protein
MSKKKNTPEASMPRMPKIQHLCTSAVVEMAVRRGYELRVHRHYHGVDGVDYELVDTKLVPSTSSGQADCSYRPTEFRVAVERGEGALGRIEQYLRLPTDVRRGSTIQPSDVRGFMISVTKED